jgi:protein-S-isoprenylcysteine O-methyltransferase Ste14
VGAWCVTAAVAPELATFPWVHRWEGLAGACTLGLAFTLGVVLPAPPTGRGLLVDLFLGRWPDPGWLGVDAKMFLYLFGAVVLEVLLLSALRWQLIAFPDELPWALGTYTVLFSFFLFEYLFFEEVHLYTYDFVAERVGFKLGWGCLTFYPYFYGIGGWSQAGRPDPGHPWWWSLVAGAVFFTGWGLSRGANLQKFLHKTRPGRPFLGIAPEVLVDGDQRLLVNGFWGVSRHVNYLGEIGMALGLVVALGRPGDPVPWLYPLYYVLLLVPRQRDDDRRCAAKYGALWETYVQRVPWRIVPFVY